MRLSHRHRRQRRLALRAFADRRSSEQSSICEVRSHTPGCQPRDKAGCILTFVSANLREAGDIAILNISVESGARAVKREDLEEMARRCRLIAESADEFTKTRLLELAIKYEARSSGMSLASQRLVTISRPHHHRNVGNSA